MKKLCIFHGSCADGFTSAWVVRKYYGEDHVEFFAGVYGNPPPDVTDRDVILVDFSYKRDVMLRIIDKAKSVLILDHHKTAQEDLTGLERANVKVVFDMNRSGARITWDHYFKGFTPPKLLEHVEDRDLWRFNLAHTREISASIFSYEYTFENWDMLMYGHDIEDLVIEGKAIERKHFKDIKELLNVAYQTMVLGGIEVKCANLPYTMSSDAGHILMENGEPFGACYYDTPTHKVFSLRSHDNGPDVSEIAKMYGGGGHRNAAGCRLTHEQCDDIMVKL